MPGDHTPAAAYDLARSICRWAERNVVRLREAGHEVDDEVLRYLNRLSDLLWLFGRTPELTPNCAMTRMAAINFRGHGDTMQFLLSFHDSICYE